MAVTKDKKEQKYSYRQVIKCEECGKVQKKPGFCEKCGKDTFVIVLKLQKAE